MFVQNQYTINNETYYLKLIHNNTLNMYISKIKKLYHDVINLELILN